MNGEEAIAWVNRYQCLVEKEIRKFMVNTPYDLEDFLHDAYEAALLAAEVSNRKGDLLFHGLLAPVQENRFPGLTLHLCEDRKWLFPVRVRLGCVLR